jgi:outer membrane protein TolC
MPGWACRCIPAAACRHAAGGSGGHQCQPVCAPGRLRLQVAEAYFNVLRARHAASVASQYLQSLQSYQRDVNNFFRKGVVARGDVLGAELAVADAEQKQISARQAESLSQSAYNRLLGRDFSPAG